MARIVVGVTTRARPRMLARLLESFEALDIPGGDEVEFAIVENAGCPSLDETVLRFAASVSPRPVSYEVEPSLGIPFARNHVLDIALRRDADLLAFVDDDETVAHDWLIALRDAQRSRGLHLVGGPVRVAPAEGATWSRLVVHRGLVARNRRVEARCAERTGRGTDHRTPTVTNNWLADLTFVRAHGIRFDESLGFSGGSDIRFFTEAQRAGARTGWAPEAIVYEYVPPERLSLRYQFGRTRDQANASFHRRYSRNSLRAWTHTLPLVALKLASIPGLVVLSLLDRGASLTHAARAAGYAWGRILALAGVRSCHYRKVQGS